MSPAGFCGTDGRLACLPFWTVTNTAATVRVQVFGGTRISFSLGYILLLIFKTCPHRKPAGHVEASGAGTEAALVSRVQLLPEAAAL